MQATSRHYYRIEISGGHTGGAYAYRSGIFGSVAEAERALVAELSDTQTISFLVLNGPRFTVEYYEDGELKGTTSAFAAVKLGLPKRRMLAFSAAGALLGYEFDDPEALLEDPVLGPVLEGEVDVKPRVELASLGLPAPSGQGLRGGKDVAYTRDGEQVTQPYGWVGGWNDPAFARFEKKKAKAKEAEKVPSAVKLRATPRAKAPPASTAATPKAKISARAKSPAKAKSAP